MTLKPEVTNLTGTVVHIAEDKRGMVIFFIKTDTASVHRLNQSSGEWYALALDANDVFAHKNDVRAGTEIRPGLRVQFDLARRADGFRSGAKALNIRKI